MKKFYDTCALLHLREKAFRSPFVISMHTLYELEQIKTSRSKAQDVKYAARQVVRLLDQNQGLFTVTYFSLPDSDTRILPSPGLDAEICYNAYLYHKDYEPIEFITDDISCRCIARDIYGLDAKSSEPEPDIYTGYLKIRGTSAEINDYIDFLSENPPFCNQYLIIENTETDQIDEFRYNGEDFVALRLPNSGYMKAKNSLQRCALDLMMNREISIVAVLGTYGSGKSFLTTKMALYHVLEKGHQSSILGIREPSGEGTPVGYLKGTLEDKTRNFFLPIEQQLPGGEFELEALRQRGVLSTNIPYYMKGTTYSNTIMLVDEAEDLTEAQIRLVGTRLGENSRVFMSGDYGQSLVDKTSNNPLVKMCNVLRGNPVFGCIYLDDDVRSSASRIFATLFK